MATPKPIYQLFLIALIGVSPYCHSQITVREGTFISGELYVVQNVESSNLESVTVFLCDNTSLSGKNSFSSNVKVKFKEKPFKKPRDKRENQIAKTSKKAEVSLPKTPVKNYLAFSQSAPSQNISNKKAKEIATVASFQKFLFDHTIVHTNLENKLKELNVIWKVEIFNSQISINDSLPRAPPFLKDYI